MRCCCVRSLCCSDKNKRPPDDLLIILITGKKCFHARGYKMLKAPSGFFRLMDFAALWLNCDGDTWNWGRLLPHIMFLFGLCVESIHSTVTSFKIVDLCEPVDSGSFPLHCSSVRGGASNEVWRRNDYRQGGGRVSVCAAYWLTVCKKTGKDILAVDWPVPWWRLQAITLREHKHTLTVELVSLNLHPPVCSASLHQTSNSEHVVSDFVSCSHVERWSSVPSSPTLRTWSNLSTVQTVRWCHTGFV